MDTFTLFIILFPCIFGLLMLLKWYSDRNFGTVEERRAEMYGYSLEPAPPMKRQQRRPVDQAQAIVPIQQAAYTVPSPILPETPAIKVLSFGETLQALVNSLHLLIVAESEAGKSTAAQAVLVGRVKIRNKVIVLDPHANPLIWCGVQAVGMGRDYAAISEAMDQLLSEMDIRFKRQAKGDIGYDPMSIFIDEWPAIQSHCKNAGAFMTELAQEGRKVGMRLVIMTQSDRVESLGISGKGDIRGNFTFLFLGKKAAKAVPATATMIRPAAIIEGVDTLPVTVDGMDRFKCVTVDQSSVMKIVSTIPESKSDLDSVTDAIDFDAERDFWLGDSLTSTRDEDHMVESFHAQNQGTSSGNHTRNQQSGNQGTSNNDAQEPAQPIGNPSNVERAAIEKWLTDGMSANAIAAELGGKRVTRLQQIKAVREAMQPAVSEPDSTVTQAVAA